MKEKRRTLGSGRLCVLAMTGVVSLSLTLQQKSWAAADLAGGSSSPRPKIERQGESHDLLGQNQAAEQNGARAQTGGQPPVTAPAPAPVVKKKKYFRKLRLMANTLMKGASWWAPGFKKAYHTFVDSMKWQGTKDFQVFAVWGGEELSEWPYEFKKALWESGTFLDSARSIPWEIWTKTVPRVWKEGFTGSTPEARALNVTGGAVEAGAFALIVAPVGGTLAFVGALVWVPGTTAWKLIKLSGDATGVIVTNVGHVGLRVTQGALGATTSVGAALLTGALDTFIDLEPPVVELPAGVDAERVGTIVDTDAELEEGKASPKAIPVQREEPEYREVAQV